MDEAAPHILVVDDDERLRELLQHYLSDQGFFVSVARDAAQATQWLTYLQFDAMVLDVMMPEQTGMEWLASYGGEKPPVLMLTAMAEPEDRIRGLELGVADYLAKPFEPRELVLRLRNVMRAQAPVSPRASTQDIRFGSFRFDITSQRLFQHDEQVYLTSGEAQCLTALAMQAGKPVSRERLAELTSGQQEKQNERSVDVQINRLRKKIEASAGRPVYIQTVRGEGYVLQPD